MSKKIKISSMVKSFVKGPPKEEGLLKIKQTISSILQHQSVIEYSVNYKTVYTLVHNKGGDDVYELIVQHLDQFITDLSQKSLGASQLPVHLCEMWEKFKASLKAICALSSYMDNTYIKETMKPGFYIYGLGLFKDNIFLKGKVAENMREWLVQESMKSKQYDAYEKDILKSIIGMLIEMGMGMLNVYTEVFETNYFQQTTKFYKKEAETKVRELSIGEYFNLINKRIKEEIEFCHNVISHSSQDGIKKIIYSCFIEAHLDEIFTENALLKLIKKNDLAIIRKIYDLFCEKGNLLLKLKTEFNQALKILVEEVLTNESIMKKPLVVIEELFKVLEVFINIKTVSFKRNQQIEVESNQTFEKNINLTNALAVFLSVYLDNYIKKQALSQSDQQIENSLQKIFNLFAFIRDKDIFEAKHRHFLAQRLQDQNTRNPDLELTIVKFLKQECGLKFVSKIQGMVSDIISNDVADSEIFSLTVLTANNWPQEKFLHINLPLSLAELSSLYTQKYVSSHVGRRLIFRYDYGSCLLTFNSKRKYTLIGSIYQGCLLLLFNQDNSFSLTDLLKAIGGTEKEVKRHILGLVKVKILQKTSKGKTLLNDDIISLNLDFQNSLNRIKLEIVNFEKEEEKVKEEDTNKAVESDRKFFLEATIVKIMKMRKSLEHKDLINEILKFCVGRFNPDIKMIKERISNLIEKEYLERDRQQSEIYHYIS